MADPEPPEVLNALVRLMGCLDNPAEMSEDQLVAAALDARETKKKAEVAAAAELARRGWSWRKIGDALGVNFATAHGWVKDAGLLPSVKEARTRRGLTADEEQA